MQTEFQSDRIIEDIRKLLGIKWNNKIWTFLSGKEMKNIVHELIELKESGNYFVPSLKDVFTPYTTVNPDNIKVVIITSMKTSITDIAFGNQFPMQPNSIPMKKVLETISKTEEISVHLWASQGVLQLSTAMTSTLRGSHHYDIWKQWVSYMINKINEIAPNAPVILIGKGAVKYKEMVRSKNIFVVDTWPVIDAHNCWLKVNDILLDQNKKPIKWTLPMRKINKKNAAIRREIAAKQFYGERKKQREEKERGNIKK